MSELIKTLPNTGPGQDTDLDVTRFLGRNNQPCVQLTQGFGSLDTPGHIQLTVRDSYLVAIALMEFVKSEASRQKESLENLIKENQELKKTIIKDAIDCTRFIEQLKILEIPVRFLY